MRKKLIVNVIRIPLNVSGLIAAVCAICFIVLSCTWMGGDIPHKSDEELIANFQTHRSEFNQLLQMISEDKGLLRVDYNWTSPEKPQSVGVSQERIDKYRNLFNVAGIPRGFYAFHDKEFYMFLASTQGLGVSGSGKGYVYSKNPLTPLVEDLDKYRQLKDKPHGYRAYRRIEENWYLFFDTD